MLCSIKQTRYTTVEVDTDDMDEAMSIIDDAFMRGRICLDDDNSSMFVDVGCAGNERCGEILFVQYSELLFVPAKHGEYAGKL